MIKEANPAMRLRKVCAVRRTGRISAKSAVTLALSVITGSAAIAALCVAAASPSAVAADRAPAPTHRYTTWRAAQRAAGFALLRPSHTYGLRISGKIEVNSCPQLHSTWVLAAYASARAKPRLGIMQVRHNDGCAGNLPPSVKLRTYHVDGVKATLYGACRLLHDPPCKHLAIDRFLVWTKGRVYYVVSSFDERPATVVGFARKLKAVG
jgi:predicted metal-binding protein